MDSDVCLSSLSAMLEAAREALRRDRLLLGLDGLDSKQTIEPTASRNETDETPENDHANREQFQNDNEDNYCDDGALNFITDEEHTCLNNCEFENVDNKETDNFYSSDFSKLFKKHTHPNIAMLKTGEYSPNNPELGNASISYGEDLFLGFGLYGEKRKKLLQKRQNEYQEYLTKQNQMNLLLKNQSKKPTKSKMINDVKNLHTDTNAKDDHIKNNTKQSTSRRPSSVAVQTDPEELALMTLDRRSDNSIITQAERELSPRPPINSNTSDWRMLVEHASIGTQNNLIIAPVDKANKKYQENVGLVSGYMGNKFLDDAYTKDYINDFNDLGKNIYRKDSPRARLLQDLSHTYMPSLFDAEAIRQRNAKLEEEAAYKRMAYQQELKKQIEEQQRIREERKIREKLLEEAETRRLEDQLKALRLAHESEVERQKELSIKIRNDAIDYEQRHLKLLNEIETEKRCAAKVKNNITSSKDKNVEYSKLKVKEKNQSTSNSKPDTRHDDSSVRHNPVSDLLGYNVKRNNQYVGQDIEEPKAHYSKNISENSPSYSVNTRESQPVMQFSNRTSNMGRSLRLPRTNDETKILTNTLKRNRPSYEPAFLTKKITDMIDTKGIEKNNGYSNLHDSLPIPVLREPEQRTLFPEDTVKPFERNTEAMKNLERRWQVPAVQKNILKNNYHDGKQENILTQLGSIRKQLQLEQLKLDQSHYFNNQKLVK